MNSYKHVEWIKFREEVIKLDGGKCLHCHRSRADGVVLQVHHKSYLAGRMPWHYRHDECETLCKGCHAQEHGIIMPQADWTLVGSDDLGDLCGNCEYCGTELRYVFAIIHPKWGALAVGTDCCDRLTMSTAASEYHDRFVKAREARGRFISSKRWKLIGADWAIKQKGISVRVSPMGGKFRVSMDGAMGKAQFEALIDAKLKVFDLIESGEAGQYLALRRQRMRAELESRLGFQAIRGEIKRDLT